MIAEGLIIKGLVAIGHWIAAHATTASIVTAGKVILTKLTISQLLSATITAGFVAGCITWTSERINNVKNGVSAILDKNYTKAIKEFGSFAISAGVDINLLPDTVEAGLEKMGLSTDDTRKITNWVKEHELEIAKYIRTHK